MAQYRVRYVTYAAEQLDQLPRSMRTAFDARVGDLERDPYAVGKYDKRNDNYTTTFGGSGIILYTFSDFYPVSGGTIMVTILRITWFE
ncbi:MAG TPA: hypothetical protein VFO16_17210 [Pseudonocardiaceae bacterium]|nr:hypothetical protein [Pseudonocardiaceae bacterium]